MDKESLMAIFVILLLVGAIVFVVLNIVLMSKMEYVTIDNEIIGIDTILDDEGKIEYLNVTFANGKSYDIKINQDLDLTVNSKMIIELKKEYHRFLFWMEFEPWDDYWSISKIVKVPSEV